MLVRVLKTNHSVNHTRSICIGSSMARTHPKVDSWPIPATFNSFSRSKHYHMAEYVMNIFSSVRASCARYSVEHSASSVLRYRTDDWNESKLVNLLDFRWICFWYDDCAEYSTRQPCSHCKVCSDAKSARCNDRSCCHSHDDSVTNPPTKRSIDKQTHWVINKN